MSSPSPTLSFLLTISLIHPIISRKMDAKLGGLKLSEFLILYNLSVASGWKMRRIDLAESTGLTASGITRLLLPMEKAGLVERETHERDARVSYVCINAAGFYKLKESFNLAEEWCKNMIDSTEESDIDQAEKFAIKLSERIG